MMSCAIVSAMHVTALQLSSEGLGAGRSMISAAVLVMHEFVLESKETGGVVKQDGLNNTLVQQWEEMGTGRQSPLSLQMVLNAL